MQVLVIEMNVLEEADVEPAETDIDEETSKPPRKARLDLLMDFVSRTRIWQKVVSGEITIDEVEELMTSSRSRRKTSKEKTRKQTRKKSK